MKTPIRRSQLALLFTLLTLVGVSISAQRIWEMTPLSLKAKMQSFQRAAAPPDATRQTGQPDSPANSNRNDRTASETDAAQDRFNIPLNVLPGGGGISTDSRFNTTGAIGQAVLGSASDGGRFNAIGGFWATGGLQCALTLSPASLASATQGISYNQALRVSGGTETSTFTLSGGALPGGVNLSSIVLDFDTVGILSGTPTTTGSFNFTIKATDANNCMVERAYTLQVNPPTCGTITVSPSTLPPGTVGSGYNQSFSAAGGSTSYTFTASGSLPNGLSLSSGGTLSGTPTASGSFNFTVTATDVLNCVGSRAYTLTINCAAITLNPASLPTATQGTAYNQSVTASGGTAPYSFSLNGGALPGGVTLSSTGNLAGTPTSTGTFNFTVRASDANGCAGERGYTIQVNPPACGTITISPNTLPPGTVGSSYNQSFSASGGSTSYTFGVSGSLPNGLSLSSGGTLAGTPSASGTFNFTVTATDVANCTGSLAYTLVINPPTQNARVVRVVASSGAPGSPVSVPIELVAQGDENALSFSLTFDPAVLSNPQAALGSDAGAASMIANTNQVAAGRLGLILTLPAGQSFSAAVRRIFVVTFTIAANVSTDSTSIGFGDQPVPREISNVAASALSATYTGAAVSITRGIEADVTPRPTGNGDVTTTDLVLMGRFIAQLDAPALGSEFQRADCAPRSTLGNGVLGLADLVQTGRYVARLDDLVPAGGPTAPINLVAGGSLLNARRNSDRSTERWVRLLGRGEEPGLLALTLNASGDENALSFGLRFNPSQWRFVAATASAAATHAMLTVNDNEASQGRVGFVLVLPPGQTFAPGAQDLVSLRFKPVAKAGKQTTTPVVGFADALVACEVVAADASPLAARFTGTPNESEALGLTELSHVPTANGGADQLAREQVVAAFGQDLAAVTANATAERAPTELVGTRVEITDSRGVTHNAPLLFVSPEQVTYQIPAKVAAGEATVTVLRAGHPVAQGVISITSDAQR
ncbi:MAG: putative Ig domain-containing protein [Acidobacteria bacterium]|nr:putative Ig domain-containing protein [Acidobacteriota bacterium]MBI3423472.1 putative Ig domain-containing protein [Acidobacteriota bacterium]